MHLQRPPTPDCDSVSSMRSRLSETGAHVPRPDAANLEASKPHSHDPGLGISLPQPPKTPTKHSSIASATAAALSPPLSSPPPRTKTPLNTHKKLPKPPVSSRTPSPLPSASRPKWPEQDFARTQTLRSLSESIISSYAKRGQLDVGTVPPDMPTPPESLASQEMSASTTGEMA